MRTRGSEDRRKNGQESEESDTEEDEAAEIGEAAIGKDISACIDFAVALWVWVVEEVVGLWIGGRDKRTPGCRVRRKRILCRRRGRKI